MKYNYKKIFNIGLIAAVLCLLYTPIKAQSILDLGQYGAGELYPTAIGPALEFGDVIVGDLAFVMDGDQLGTACEDLADDLTDKIAVIGIGFVQDDCASAQKVANAMDAGAVAVLLIQNDAFPTSFEDPNSLAGIPAYVGLIEDFEVLLENLGIFEGAPAAIYYAYDDSEDVIWHEDFANGFDGENGTWETVGITSDTALWVYSPGSISGGALRHFMIDSPTRSNGAALLDTDWYLTGGPGGTLPDGPPYGDVGSELISPIIDLSESGPVTIKWWQFSVGLNSAATTPIGLYYSVDGGESWSSRINLESKTKLSSTDANPANPEIMRTFVGDAAGVAEFRFKIEFRSDFYAMLIDDVQIVEPAGTDVAIGALVYGPSTYAQPDYIAGFDVINPWLDVKNLGGMDQDNITLRVDIVNSANEIVKTQDYLLEGAIPIGETAEFYMEEGISLEGLEVGTYRAVHTLIPEDDDDEFPEDNISVYRFKITNNEIASSEMVVTSLYSAPDANTFGFGNLYEIPADLQGDYQIASIETSYYSTDTFDPEGKSIQVLISTIPDDIDEDLENFSLDHSQDPFNQEAINQVAFNNISLDGTSRMDILTAKGNEFIDANTFQTLGSIPLEKGQRYLFWTLYEDIGLALALNNANPLEYRAYLPVLYVRNDGSPYYYSGGFTSSIQGLLQVTLEFVDMVDNAPLAEDAMNIYPNPVASDVLYTELKFNEATTATIAIADMNGRIHSLKTHNNVVQQTVESNVSDLPSGMYLIRVSTKDGSKTMKFIKH